MKVAPQSMKWLVTALAIQYASGQRKYLNNKHYSNTHGIQKRDVMSRLTSNDPNNPTLNSNLNNHQIQNDSPFSDNLYRGSDTRNNHHSKTKKDKNSKKNSKKDNTNRYMSAYLSDGEGKGCTYEGVYYDHGALFKPQSCNICNCKNGNVECQTITCEQLQCENQYTPEGACCPVCPLPGNIQPPDDIGRYNKFAKSIFIATISFPLFALLLHAIYRFELSIIITVSKDFFRKNFRL